MKGGSSRRAFSSPLPALRRKVQILLANKAAVAQRQASPSSRAASREAGAANERQGGRKRTVILRDETFEAFNEDSR